ncbi:MAG: GAF domain-containing protein [Flavobacteriales bacterium]|nr:GAF domain-containing protein [Flavobacteriales bacterium]
MAEDLNIPAGINRTEQYESLIPQLRSIITGETDFVANTGNLMAGLHSAFGFHWVGCYFVKNDQLVLGPFQGPVACTRIALGKGVCGTSWKEAHTIIVPNVDVFPGHISCSSLSKSEIVVPIFNIENNVIGVLDVDSSELNDFDQTDQKYLEEIASIISQLAHL